MSHIDEHLEVQCPLAQAALRLRHFFQSHGNAAGDVARLALGVDLPLPGTAPLALARSVIITMQPHVLKSDMTPRYRVQWAPEEPGPFPLFAGEIVVEASEDYNDFVLRLWGDYTPPLGALGKGFDRALGNRLASATARHLLGQIQQHIEQAFEADEARKLPSPS